MFQCLEVGRHKKRRARSTSADGRRKVEEKVRHVERVEPFVEENKPDLIVSGGGGAFLHGTHTYDKNIKVGPKQMGYTRVVAYPNEMVSACLGWMNMNNFRWRGWRCDLIFAVLYLGVVSSLFPLCGIHDDHEAFNPNHNPLLLLQWVVRTIGSLMLRVMSSEDVSLFCFCGICFGALALQSPDHKMSPCLRYFVAFSHGIGHIAAAICCLLFVQCVAEWVVKNDVVKITTADSDILPESGLGATIYDEYKTHFYPVLKNFTHPDSSLELDPLQSESLFVYIMTSIIEHSSKICEYLFTHVPLLKTTLRIFDLPTVIAQNHHDTCAILCSGGMECLRSHDRVRYQSIDRGVFVPYLAAVTLYYIFLAVPLAGSIFGSWLALCLNLFHCQSDLGFSCVQIQHWKNFVKLHIRPDGELEIFAIGLEKVPTDWTKDPMWQGQGTQSKKKSDVRPSWTLQHPSKWVPRKDLKKHIPQIIDNTCIPKRIIKRSGAS